MSNRLKQTIYWSLFIAIALIVFLIILPLIFIMVFFPDAEIVSNAANIIGIASTIIGALSAGLGFFSIYQANQGNKQVNKILDTVQASAIFLLLHTSIYWEQMMKKRKCIQFLKKVKTLM